MVRFGNFIFHNRNIVFPLFYLVLFIPSPKVFASAETAMAIGFSVTLIGQLVRIITIGLVYIVRGGLNRRVFADKLVSTGIFAHCRNPLYVGNILILAGLGIASNSVIFNCIATPLFLFFWQAIVLAEENYLANKFAEEYRTYCKRVHRWLPAFKGLGKTISSMEFQWKRVLIREYTSAYIWMSGAVLLIAKNIYLENGWSCLRSKLNIFITILVVLLCLYLLTRYLKKAKIIVAD